MARVLIREADGGETRVIDDRSLPYFPGYVILDTLDDSSDVAPLYLSKAESDFRYTKLGDIGNTATGTGAAIKAAAIDALGSLIPVHASFYGVSESNPDNRAALDAAATAAGKGLLVLPKGRLRVVGSYSFSGRECSIIGEGTGTMFVGVSQTGPVVNFNGYKAPTSALNPRYIGNFCIEGDGISDPTKTNTGIDLSGISSVTLDNIGINKTGGPALYSAGGNSLCQWQNLTFGRPIDAGINDVPYVDIGGYFNGVSATNWGFRSVFNATDGSAIMRIKEGPYKGLVYTAHDFTIKGFWTEFLTLPEGGSIFDFAVNGANIEMPQMFDCSQVSGATDTCVLRLRNSTDTNLGGSYVYGQIYGRGSSAASIQYGVVLAQSGNHVTGTRGFKQACVRLDAGVARSYVFLGGAVGVPAGMGIVDNSGALGDNVLIDATEQYMRYRNARLGQSKSSANNSRWLFGDTTNGGGFELGGTTGPQFFTTGADLTRLFADGERQTYRGRTTTAAVFADYQVVSGAARISWFGATPVAKRAATPDATDLASAITLVNAIKADLVAYGLKTA